MRFPSKTCRSHYFFCSQHFLPAIFSICISECISSRPIVLKDTHGVQGIKYPLEPCAHTLHAQIHKRASSRRSQHSKHCFLALRVLQWLLHSHIIVRLKMESFFFFLKRSKSMQQNQRYHPTTEWHYCRQFIRLHVTSSGATKDSIPLKFFKIDRSTPEDLWTHFHV